MLYEKVQQLLKRLVRLINNFGVNLDDTTIKISPSRDYDKDLGIRAIPYYYTLASSPLIQITVSVARTRGIERRSNSSSRAATDLSESAHSP